MQGTEISTFEKKANDADIVSASNYRQQLTEYFTDGGKNEGVPTPFRAMQWFKFRSHEVTMWSGINGHGKSLMLGQLQLWLASRGQKCAIASFEMTPKQTLSRMAQQAIGVEDPTEEWLDIYSNWMQDKIWIFDKTKTIHWETVAAKAHYAATEMGMDHFVIDSLMKCGIGPDDMSAEREFVDNLCAISNDTGIHIHLVDHVRKQENEFKRITKFDVRGNGQKIDMVDNLMIVSRNKRKEREKERHDPRQEILDQPDGWLACEKQRHGAGQEGCIPLWLDVGSLLYRGTQSKPLGKFIELQERENGSSEAVEDEGGSSGGVSGGYSDPSGFGGTEHVDGGSVSSDFGYSGDSDRDRPF